MNISKCLGQKCYLYPVLFKIYLQLAVNIFAGDQIILAQDHEDFEIYTMLGKHKNKIQEVFFWATITIFCPKLI